MKTVTYGAMHFVVAFGVSYAMTGSLAIATGIAMVEPLIQTFAYFFHEKIWDKIKSKKSQASIQWDDSIDKPVIVPQIKSSLVNINI